MQRAWTQSAAERWWSKGHGTLVEGPDGRWYIVYHAYEIEVAIDRDPGATAGLLLFYSSRLYAGLGFSATHFLMHSYDLERAVTLDLESAEQVHPQRRCHESPTRRRKENPSALESQIPKNAAYRLIRAVKSRNPASDESGFILGSTPRKGILPERSS